MPRLKQMVKRTEVEVAKAKRTCKFSGESIVKGTKCLVVYDGPRERSCYSQSVALQMVNAARIRLAELENELASAT